MFKFQQILLGNRPEKFYKGGGDTPEIPKETTSVQTTEPSTILAPFLTGTPGTPAVTPQFVPEPTKFIQNSNSNLFGPGGDAIERTGNNLVGTSNPSNFQTINPAWEQWNALSAGGTKPAFTPGQAEIPASPGFYNEALELFNQGGPEFFPDTLRAPVDPLTTQAQNLGLSATDQALNFGQERRTTGQDLTDLFIQQLQKSTEDPTLDTRLNRIAQTGFDKFSEQISPQLRTQERGAGQGFGGTRGEIAQALAFSKTQDSILDASTELLAEDTESQRKFNAALFGLAPSTLGFSESAGSEIPALLMQQAAQIGDIGTFNRGEEQAGISELMARFNFDEIRDIENLQRYGGFLGQLGIPTNQTTVNSGTIPGIATPGSSPLAGALGGGLLGYQAAPFLASMFGGGAAAGAGGAAGGAAAGTSAGPYGAIAGAILGALLS
jgi:hypothetical protein